MSRIVAKAMTIFRVRLFFMNRSMLFSRFVDWIIYSMTPIRAGISRIMFPYIEKNPVLSKAETFFT
jgi:hypothetical protein